MTASAAKKLRTVHVENAASGKFGLLGLGDEDYAIDSVFFERSSTTKAFVQTSRESWHRAHGNVLAAHMAEPKHKAYKPCKTFCRARALREHGVPQELFDKSRALLQDVNRAMKSLYSAMAKQLTADLHHPLLFARVVMPDGEVAYGSVGWILTRAMFKPKEIDGVALELPPSLSVPFEVNLCTKTVCGSTDSFLDFKCIQEISMGIACLRHLWNDGEFQYCYNPPYRILWEQDTMSCLKLTTELNWVQPGELPLDDSDADSDPGTENEIEEIEQLLADFGQGPDNKGNVRKTKTQAKRRRASDDPGTYNNNNLKKKILYYIIIIFI